MRTPVRRVSRAARGPGASVCRTCCGPVECGKERDGWREIPNGTRRAMVGGNLCDDAAHEKEGPPFEGAVEYQ
jgi:hypothetical protein